MLTRGTARVEISRSDEILNACVGLYEKMSFKDITIKDIGAATSFGRTSVYNYFQTKEEIFLALLKREYDAWNAELEAALSLDGRMTKTEFAGLIADTLSRREVMLKILSMNLYDIEENSRPENLFDFKKSYGKTLLLVEELLKKYFPRMSTDARKRFSDLFFPLVYGLYPYTHVTEKQRDAMKKAKIKFRRHTVYELAFAGVKKLLGVKE